MTTENTTVHHDFSQGTDEWCAFRLTHFGASEAAAMLGISPKTKRTELLHAKSTGIAREFSDWVQKNILDYGHEVEALARSIVEDMIGTELFPVTLSKGKISASCDGLSMCETIAWENKQYNAKYFEMVSNGELPEEHWPQCQQVLHVSGAEKLFFTISDGMIEGTVGMWVYPDAGKQQQIIDGWEQFAHELAEYSPRDIQEKPIVNDIENLPAIAVQIRGEVVTSNMPVFVQKADAFIAQINTNLQTDEDFAIAEKTVKYCDKVEKELELTKSAAIAQTASIDELLRMIDRIKEQFRTKRLVLEKLVKTQKEAIKTQAILEAKNQFSDYVDNLEHTIQPIRLIVDYPDLAGASKNKRTLASLHDAIDTALANAKINASNVATALYKKLDWYHSEIANYGFLFSDLQTIIYKEAEDFMLLVKSRIEGHKKAEEEHLEAERKRIQAEAEAKAQREAEAERERIRQEEAAKIRAEQESERNRLEREQVNALSLELAESTQRTVNEINKSEAINRSDAVLFFEEPIVIAQATETPIALPTGINIIELVSSHWQISLLDALELIQSLDFGYLSTLVENRTQAAKLRETAHRIRQSAYRADKRSATEEEMKIAQELEAEAEQLEQVA